VKGRRAVGPLNVLSVERVDFVSVATRVRRFDGEILGLPRSRETPETNWRRAASSR
jgi:hypothetical protein